MNALRYSANRYQIWGSFLFSCALLLAGHACAQAPTSSTSLQHAEALVQQGHLDEAKSEILGVLKENPSSAEGFNLLGIIESDQQDYLNAIAAFEQGLKLSPSSAKIRVNIGNAYLAQKKFDLAEKEFRAVLREEPANQDANYNLGLLLMAKGEPAEAIQHFERVRPPNLATRFNLIRAYFQTKRPAQALRMATELSDQNKNDVKVHFSLGLLLASEKQFKPAELELEKADALQPATFEILYNLGQASLHNGENAKAELVLKRALSLNPDSPEALYLMAQAYSNEARPRDALELLVHAHKVAPDNTDIILLMAQISIAQNYYEDAIPLLESGVKIAPHRAELLAALGESYFMSGKVDKAIEEFKQLIEVENSARSYAFLGICYRYLGRFDEAKQYFQKGLKLDARDVTSLFNLGLIAEEQGNPAIAEDMFQQTLRAAPEYPPALLELANLRMGSRKLPEAAELLKKYVQVSRNPAAGYYKLSIVERGLHDTVAADRDRDMFQTLSKNAPVNAHYFENLFDYLENRSKLATPARDQLDMTELINQIKMHPDQPDALYLLAEDYLKTGKMDEARSTVASLDKISSGNYRTLTATGVLLARYRLYDDAIQHFRAALTANPNSDEAKFDLADAYFRKGLYSEALDTATEVSEEGRKDDAYLALLGDIYAHLGDTARAEEIFRDAIRRNPDNDQDYLSLSLIEFRESNPQAAKQTLLRAQARVPGSGKILWGLGIVSVMEGNTAEAAERFEQAVDLLPEWPGSYSLLGIFYFQTGQIAKAKEVLNRFKNNNATGGLDLNRIEQALSQAPETSPAGNVPLTDATKKQLLQMALLLADRTL